MNQSLKPFVHKVLTGKVKTIGTPGAKDPMDREWQSGIFKTEKIERLWLSETGLDGDEQGDKKSHGGPEKALFAYPIKHYTAWNKALEHVEMDMGAFGENVAVFDMDESSVCIGDTYQFGDAIIQVSQPRRPCWRPARRHRVKDLALRIQHSGMTGWYFRVLQEGYIQSGIHMDLVDRPYPEWTVAASNEVMYERKKDLKAAGELASVALLAPNWKQSLNKRLSGIASNDQKRVYGPNVEKEE